MSALLAAPLAWLLDRLFGEPRRFHPLVGFGMLAAMTERTLRREPDGDAVKRIKGALAVVLLLVPIAAAAHALASLPAVGMAIEVLLLYLALGASSLAGSAFLATHVAAASAGLTWAILDWRINAHATVLGMITGVVAGLVAITPAAGFVGPIDAIWIGIGSAIACFFFVAVIKVKLGYDDSLDVFGVHGIGGIWGALATGLWASTEINPAGANGLFYGNPGLVLIQLKAVLATAIFSGIVTFVLLKILDSVTGIRVSEQDERIGLDLTQHREAGYTQLD